MGGGWYCLGKTKPKWRADRRCWEGRRTCGVCSSAFERILPFGTMPPNSVGKITYTTDILKFEIIETKK